MIQTEELSNHITNIGLLRFTANVIDFGVQMQRIPARMQINVLSYTRLAEKETQMKHEVLHEFQIKDNRRRYRIRDKLGQTVTWYV